MDNHLNELSIFIINLQHSSERKAHMQKLCEQIGLKATFINAVDGAFIKPAEIIGKSSNEAAIRTIGRELSMGEIGCALSHRKIYQKMVDENIQQALVFEDDVEFNSQLLGALNLEDEFPLDWELVLLGHHGAESRTSSTNGSFWGRVRLSSGDSLIRPCELTYGAYGYLINQQGAVKLLNDLECMAKPLDHYTGDSEHVNLYAIDPVLIRIHDELSDNYHSMEDRNRLSELQHSLQNTKYASWYKNLSVRLGIYSGLNSLYQQPKAWLNKIKPLKKYT